MRTRDATPSDHAIFLELLAELRLPPDDPTPDAEAWEREWMRSTFFVEEGGRVVGYGVTRVAGDVGLVLHVVVAPAARGRGVGRAVMAAAGARLRRAGCSQWLLQVRPENAAAIALYERMGMRFGYRSVSMALAWDASAALAREGAIEARVLEPIDDERFERAFELPRGRLGELRSRPGRVLLGIDSGEPLAVACFDPAFPGATPFRVRRPTLAPALLDAIRARARSGDRQVRLHVEDDPGLERALQDVGAITMLELMQMRGTIPE